MARPHLFPTRNLLCFGDGIYRCHPAIISPTWSFSVFWFFSPVQPEFFYFLILHSRLSSQHVGHPHPYPHCMPVAPSKLMPDGWISVVVLAIVCCWNVYPCSGCLVYCKSYLKWFMGLTDVWCSWMCPWLSQKSGQHCHSPLPKLSLYWLRNPLWQYCNG